MIPSISSINDFWPESKQLIAVPHDLQRTISSPTLAIHIAYNLLAALCDPASQKSRKCMFEQQYPWIIDTCEELWCYFRRWSTASDKRPLHDETTALYMQVINNLTIPGSGLVDGPSASVKAATTSINSIAGLIESLATSSMSDSNQGQLALMATRLCRTARTERCQRKVLHRRCQPSQAFDTEALKQSATRICENVEVLSGLHKDLQVFTFVFRLT
jgi:serine/threonine-protein kinase ATR